MSWLEIASYWHEIQTSSGGTGTSLPGQVLLNIAGSVAGDAGLTYDAGTDTLTVASVVNARLLQAVSGGEAKVVVDSGSIKAGIAFASDHTIQWAPGSNAQAATDTGLRRVSAGLVGVTDGSTGNGAIQAAGFKVITGSRPTADAASAGMIWYVAGGTGVADTLEVCVKSGADTYSWVSLF